MVVHSIVNNDIGTKFEIFKDGENNYSYKYYEYFANIGWKFVLSEKNYSKNCIECEFDIKIL